MPMMMSNLRERAAVSQEEFDAMRDERDQARTRLDEAVSMYETQHELRSDAETALEQAQAAAAQMREALEVVEWIHDEVACYCPWCSESAPGHPRPGHIMGHAPDCPRQAALATDAGREILERLRSAETAAAQMREALEAVEWTDGREFTFCPSCFADDWASEERCHKENCKLQAALATDAGRDLLERLRSAETARDEALARAAEAEARLKRVYSSMRLDDWEDL